MLEQQVRLINPLGLHARAAAKVVKCAAVFESSVALTDLKKGTHADARSILSLLALSAVAGTELLISVSGSDEEQAMETLVEMFRTGFGELV
ncbi:MAG: HPr family phosphocarrier protein [Chloracidobacterium sp.]|nr:HPr family phosphocarrier protein [Chloracidobacterium sp.]MCC6824335.1 HPr family phosphocarrier protein [Acidobacteriota bacterium]MCO5332605.1 HPr family phosphocarrier protein [Pyrinomonadaceae bacterium]